MADIVLVEGQNELNVEMTPIALVSLAPCVYCGATFTTEAELIAHMSASHPGKPYLVYAYPLVEQVASGGRLSFGIKVYSTAVPMTDRPGNYAFVIYIPNFPTYPVTIGTPANQAILYVGRGSPEGFYESTRYMEVEYIAGFDGFPNFRNIPPGIYPLYSLAIYRKDIKDVGWVLAETFWSGVDTGEKITVV